MREIRTSDDIQGLPDDMSVLDITTYNNTVIIATDNGVYTLEDAGLEKLYPLFRSRRTENRP